MHLALFPYLRGMRIRYAILTFLLLVSTGKSQTVEQARADLAVLCSDSLAGRGYQHNGHGRAAHYLSERFRDLGLEPWSPATGSSRPTWFQGFSFKINLVDSARLTLNHKALTVGKDFIVHPASGSLHQDISCKNLDYGMGEDWEGEKIEGKGVLMKLGFPPHYDQDSRNREMFQSQTELDFKLEMAALYKPAALFLVKDKLTASLASRRLDLPVIEVLRSAVPKKVNNASLQVATAIREVSAFNVMGVIPGQLYPDSFIIVSAHYDHLGTQGDAVFRGANDNASGVAFMLALAGELQKAENAPAYSIVFIGFGAEEAGLKGSRYFVRQLDSTLLPRIRFVLNFDLMGNGDQGICLVAGTDFPRLAGQVQQNMPASVPVELRANAPNSDHYPFIQAGVPALFTYTKGGPPWYHDVMDVPTAVSFPRWEELKQAYLKVLLNCPGCERP